MDGTGYRGEYVEIRGGFMRNLLFPTKRAIYATDENTRIYEAVDRVRNAMLLVQLLLQFKVWASPACSFRPMHKRRGVLSCCWFGTDEKRGPRWQS